MDFRHIFLPHPRFFSNQKLGRTQGEKGEQNKKQKTPKDPFYMIQLLRNVLILEMKLVTVQLLKQLFNYLYLLRRLLSSGKETPQIYFLG